MFKACRRGHSLLMTTSVVLVSLMLGVFTIDIPVYFNAQNQLQTAVNAAAIAGAYKLPESYSVAEEAAYELAAKNLVAGMPIQEGDLEFAYSEGEQMTMSVSAHKEVPSIMRKMLCALKFGGGQFDHDESGDNEESGSSGGGNCDSMTVHAHAKAVPAARDTILVIDTSSSMGYGYAPIHDVKDAAENFVDMVAEMDNKSVDRVGVVTFDRTSSKVIGLTSKSDYGGDGFEKVKSEIQDLDLYSGSGWNTNYHAGLKTALDEMESKGRKNATKTIIFLTDGYPNLPAPDSYVSYSKYTPYKKCSDKVNNSKPVKDLCYYKKGKKYCYYMPDKKIQDWMIEDSGGKACGQTYVDHMILLSQAQADRAKNMDVTIHTIAIFDEDTDSSSFEMLRRLLTDDDWDPYLLEYFATTTEGEQYASADADPDEINEIYETIAKNVRVKLAL